MSGVRVHGHGEGTAIDFTAIDSNMELVWASSDCCVASVGGGKLLCLLQLMDSLIFIRYEASKILYLLVLLPHFHLLTSLNLSLTSLSPFLSLTSLSLSFPHLSLSLSRITPLRFSISPCFTRTSPRIFSTFPLLLPHLPLPQLVLFSQLSNKLFLSWASLSLSCRSLPPSSTLSPPSLSPPLLPRLCTY